MTSTQVYDRKRLYHRNNTRPLGINNLYLIYYFPCFPVSSRISLTIEIPIRFSCKPIRCTDVHLQIAKIWSNCFCNFIRFRKRFPPIKPYNIYIYVDIVEISFRYICSTRSWKSWRIRSGRFPYSVSDETLR